MIGPKNNFFNGLLLFLAMASPAVAQIPVSWWSSEQNADWPQNYWVEQGVVLSISQYCDSLSLLDTTYRLREATAFFTADWRRLTPVEFAAGVAAGLIDKRIVVWSEAGEAGEGMPLLATKVQAAAAASPVQRFALLDQDVQGRSLMYTARPARALIDEFGDENGDPVIDFLGQVLQEGKMPQPGDQVSLLLHEGTVVRVKLLQRPAQTGYRIGLDAEEKKPYLTLAQ